MNAADVLRCLNSLEDDRQLAALERIVETLDDPHVAAQLMVPLFGVLERFPWTESYGLFWTILHALERVDRYALQLVESVRRSAGEFNLMMIHRILNSGTRRAGGADLRDLLLDVAHHAESHRARATARAYLAQQGGDAL